MRPREFFWFGTKRYQSLINGRESDQLRTDELHKEAKLVKNNQRVPLEIVITVITHGLLVWLVFISLRSTSVAKHKLGIIRSELKQRRMTKYADRLQELEQINGKPFNPAEIDAVLQILDASDAEQDAQRTSPTARQDAYWPDDFSEISDDVPPPYQAAGFKRS